MKENCYEENTIQAIYTNLELVDTFYTEDDAVVEKQTMILEEPHEECNITLDRDAITEIDIPTTDEVIDNAKALELESNGFETVKEAKTTQFSILTNIKQSCVKV